MEEQVCRKKYTKESKIYKEQRNVRTPLSVRFIEKGTNLSSNYTVISQYTLQTVVSSDMQKDEWISLKDH